MRTVGPRLQLHNLWAGGPARQQYSRPRNKIIANFTDWAKSSGAASGPGSASSATAAWSPPIGAREHYQDYHGKENKFKYGGNKSKIQKGNGKGHKDHAGKGGYPQQVAELGNEDTNRSRQSTLEQIARS